MGWVKLGQTEYTSHEFLNSFLIVEVKIITIFFVVLNECRENT